MMAKVLNYLEKRAINQSILHPTNKEYFQVRIITTIIRYGLIGLTTYCSYFFVYDLFNTHILNSTLVLVCSLIIAGTIEYLGNEFVGYFFKNLFKGIYKTSIALFFASLVFYGLSFYSATNGLALRQYKKNDTSELIKRNNIVEIDNLKTDYQNQIQEIETNIALLKNQTWRGKLSQENINTIKEYNNKIFSLRSDLNNKIDILNNNLTTNINNTKIHAENESNRFYKVVFAIMIFQVLITFVNRYLKHLIYKEAAKDTEQTEQGRIIASQIEEEARPIMIDFFKQLGDKMLLGFNAAFTIPTKQLSNHNTIDTEAVEIKESETKETAKETEPEQKQENDNDKKNTWKTVTGFATGLLNNETEKKENVTINKNATQAENTKESKENCNDKNKNTYSMVTSNDNSVTLSVTKKVCLNCGKTIKIKERNTRKYCNDKCKAAYNRKKGFDEERIKIYNARKKK